MKWSIVTIVAVIGTIFSFTVVIPFCEFLVLSKSTKLQHYIGLFIDKKFDVENVLVDEVLYPAWNLKESKPYMFSKALKQHKNFKNTPY